MFKVNFNVIPFKNSDKLFSEDVIAHFGRVAFCNGNKGCYVNNGTYTVEEV